MSENPCPFCGEKLEEFITDHITLYSHYDKDFKPSCEVLISFEEKANFRERFERRESVSDEACPFCGGSVNVVKDSYGDTLVKCTNRECEAVISFGRLAILNHDRQPKYTAEETLELFRKRL